MKFATILLSFLIATMAQAAPSNFAYEGRLTDSSNVPITGSVLFRLQVRTPSSSPNDCVLYQEDQNVTLSTDGFFSIDVGAASATRTGGTFEIASTLPQVFSSGNAMGALTCSSGGPSYTPTAAENRRLRISFSLDSGSTWQSMSQDVAINSAPFAMVADSVQGVGASSILQVNTSAGKQLSQTNLENIFGSTAYYTELSNLVAGTSTTYAKKTGGTFTGAIQIGAAPLPGLPSTGQIAIDSGDSNKLKWYDGGAWQTVGTGAGSVTGVSGGAGISSTGGSSPTISLTTVAGVAGSFGSSSTIPIFSVDGYGRISSSSSVSVNDASKVPLIGGTMTGPLVLNADPSLGSGAATKQYVDAVSTAASGAYLRYDGTNVMTASLNVGSNKIINLAAPTVGSDAATKSYADSKLMQKPLPASTPSASQDGQALKWDNTGGTWQFFTPSAGTVNSVAGTASQIVNTNTAADPVLALASYGPGAGVYGASFSIPILTVDSFGRVQAASQAALVLPPSLIGSAGASGGDVLKYNGSFWAPGVELDPSVASWAKVSPTADFVTTGNILALNPTGVTAGTYGSSTLIPWIAVDSRGRITNISTNPVSVGPSQLSTAGAVTGYYPRFNAGSWSYSSIQASDLTAALGAGNLGIGQGSPTASLHLRAGTAAANTAPLKFATGTNLSTPESGAVEFDGTNLYFTTSTNTRKTIATTSTAYSAGSTILAASGTAASPGLSFNADPSTGLFWGGANTIQFSGGGLQTMDVSPSGLHITTPAGTSGQLGLVDPSYALGSPSFKSFLRGYDNIYSPVWSLGVVNNIPQVVQFSADDASHSLAFSTNNIERMRIAPNGNIGIGTSTPAFGFHILQNGPVAIESNTAPPPRLWLRHSGTPSVQGDTLGQFELQGQDGSPAVATGAFIRALASENWSSSTSHGTTLSFATTANGTAGPQEALRIESGGAIVLSSYGTALGGYIDHGGKSVVILSAGTGPVTCIRAGAAGQLLYIVSPVSSFNINANAGCGANHAIGNAVATKNNVTLINDGTKWYVVGTN